MLSEQRRSPAPCWAADDAITLPLTQDFAAKLAVSFGAVQRKRLACLALVLGVQAIVRPSVER